MPTLENVNLFREAAAATSAAIFALAWWFTFKSSLKREREHRVEITALTDKHREDMRAESLERAKAAAEHIAQLNEVIVMLTAKGKTRHREVADEPKQGGGGKTGTGSTA